MPVLLLPPRSHPSLNWLVSPSRRCSRASLSPAYLLSFTDVLDPLRLDMISRSVASAVASVLSIATAKF